MVSSPVTLAQAIERIHPADAGAMRRAGERQAILTKPPGSLGRLEEVSIRLAGIYGSERPSIGGKAVIVAAADHGVVAQGVTGYPQEVTAQMVLNFLAGGAAISVMCRRLGIQQVIVDAGVATELPPHPELRVVRIGPGTDDISQGPAMSEAQAVQSLEAGINLAAEVIASGVDLLATGDMGIGNTTASAAIAAAATGRPASETTSEGTGRSPEELSHKTLVVQRSLAANFGRRPEAHTADGLELLSKVGGFEIGLLAGVILGSAMLRRAVVIDGFISGAAALIACALAADARDYMLPSHVSAERGHRIALDRLGLTPLLNLRMRLGEGTGAALAMPIIEAAAACLSEMATFTEAGVSEREAAAADPDEDEDDPAE